MLLKYFYDKKLAHASYMVGCQATGEAIIIDPGRDIDIYLDSAEAEDMRIVAATETHIHADFVSGSRALAHRVGATLYLSDEGDESWKYQFADEPGLDARLVVDGDTFHIGNIKFAVMHTPGHTPEHIALVLTDMGGGATKPMGIFTGDFVFVGSIGRPDLLEKAAGIANTSIAGARQMFRSVQRFKQLPDYLQVWPAHGAGSACGKGLGAIPSSTVGYEKLFNPMLGYTDEDAFVEALLDGQPEPPKYFAVMKRVNKEGPALVHGFHAPDRLPAHRLPELLADGVMVVDTRSTGDFAARHLAGTVNIPLDQLPQWAGWLVDYDRPLYLIADSHQAAEAVRDLAYIGIDTVAGYFDLHAIEQLGEHGIAPESYEVMTPDQVSARILNDEVVLVDVRNQAEWEEGHLPHARHIMLGYLMERADEVVNGKPIVVQCRSGNRSAIGASILKAKGARTVINLMGGFRDWAAAGLPIER